MNTMWKINHCKDVVSERDIEIMELLEQWKLTDNQVNSKDGE